MTVPQAQLAYRRASPVVEVTNLEEMTSILEGLHASCGKWHAMPSKQKIGILQQVRRRAVKASMDLGKATAKVSGFADQNDSDNVHPASANMLSLFLGPTVARTATAYIKLLDELEAKGAPAPVEASRKTADGRNVLDMGACTEIDGILSKGGHAYLYTQAGKELTQGQEAAKYLSTESAGVAVVLGAGNQGFLSMEDCMYMLFDKNMPVLLKHHPIQGEVAQMWEYIMEPLENVGVYKGVLADQALTQSALYSELTAAAHLTGAAKTYESILWGPGAEGEKRKAADDPLLKVPFTAELGNATPVFITPAEWTSEELQRVAKKTAFATTNNAGCNCLAPKVILMSADWPQADEFESIVKESFKKTKANPCWYPGAKSRYDTFLAKHPGCDMVESMVPEGMTYSSEVLPWAFKSITLDKLEDAATIPGLAEEFFAPVVIFLRLPSDSSASTPPVVTTASDGEEGSVPELSEASAKVADNFLKTIPGFCKKYVFGNLTCGLFLPDTVRAALPETSQNCIDNLQYGQVVVNNAPIVGYTVQRGTWGAWMGPETSQKNVGSGIGKLHNFRQIDGLEKFVLDFPASHNIELGDPSAIPGILVPLIAGISGGYGIRGVWAAISPW